MLISSSFYFLLSLLLFFSCLFFRCFCLKDSKKRFVESKGLRINFPDLNAPHKKFWVGHEVANLCQSITTIGQLTLCINSVGICSSNISILSSSSCNHSPSSSSSLLYSSCYCSSSSSFSSSPGSSSLYSRREDTEKNHEA